MAKTRLTNADREAIRDAVIEYKFAPIENGLAAEEFALAIQARSKAYGDYLTTIDSAPDGAFPTEGQTWLNVGGKKIKLRYGQYPTYVRVFSKHCRYDEPMLSLAESDAFAKKVMIWAERSEATKSERRKLRENVGGTLSFFKSFDDLQAGWPEAERFITARWRERPDYTANAPAVTLRDLSTALDLPPDTEDEAEAA